MCSLMLSAACQRSRDIRRAPPGKPTILRTHESPLEAICRIQEEFRSLPKPLMQELVYHEGYSETRIGAGRMTHRPRYEVRLTDAGNAFTAVHSDVEIVVALAPFLSGPDQGREAVVLMAGLPTQSYYHVDLAGVVGTLVPRGPLDRQTWRERVFVPALSAATMVYAMAPSRGTGRYHLEWHIRKALEDLSSVPVWAGDAVPPRSARSFDELAAQYVPPPISPELAACVDTYSREFLELVLYPRMLVSGHEADMGTAPMMWLLDLQQEFWPIVIGPWPVFGVSSRSHKALEFEQRFHLRVAAEIPPVCPADAEVGQGG